MSRYVDRNKDFVTLNILLLKKKNLMNEDRSPDHCLFNIHFFDDNIFFFSIFKRVPFSIKETVSIDAFDRKIIIWHEFTLISLGKNY